MGLTAKTCTPCRGGVPPFSKNEAEKLIAETPGWELKDGATKIEGKFKFDDFVSAMVFVQKVGNLAETEGHHPDITFGWGYCHIILYTHKIGGLHENDFIMAAKINALL